MWLKMVGQEDQFPENFSKKHNNLFKDSNLEQAIMTNRFSMTGFKSAFNKTQPIIYTNFVNKLTQISQEKINTNLATIMKENISLKEAKTSPRGNSRWDSNNSDDTNNYQQEYTNRPSKFEPQNVEKEYTNNSQIDPFFFADNQQKETQYNQKNLFTSTNISDGGAALAYMDENQKIVKAEFYEKIIEYCKAAPEEQIYQAMESFKGKINFLFLKSQRVDHLNFLNNLQKTICFEGTTKTDMKRQDIMNFSSVQMDNAKKNYSKFVNMNKSRKFHK